MTKAEIGAIFADATNAIYDEGVFSPDQTFALRNMLQCIQALFEDELAVDAEIITGRLATNLDVPAGRDY